jgi:hypothetical protein
MANTLYTYNDKIQFANYAIRITDTGIAITNTTSSTTNGIFKAASIRYATAIGTVAGYTSGGDYGYGNVNVIDKFPFASDANATDVGDLTDIFDLQAGQSSATHGHATGGVDNSYTNRDVINRFPFATNANATSPAILTIARYAVTGQSSPTHGYTSGGLVDGPGIGYTNTIDKFSFAFFDANATDVADLINGSKGFATGQSSTENGYVSGGAILGPAGPGLTNQIDKFPFATDANSSDVGYLTVNRGYQAGQSSLSHGYTSGGTLPPYLDYTNVIDKFPFASDANATDVGDLSENRGSSVGQSSTVSGYSSGGWVGYQVNVIEKFPFSTDANATDVGDLTQGRYGSSGQQD